MRGYRSILFATAALCASSGARAADALKFGAAPAWVVPQAIPPASEKAKDRPVAMLLHDQQTMLEPGKISTFSELAFKIQKPDGLAAGNLSFAWNPATDTVTVNTLEVRRGDKVIDVLKSGQTFTTLRRESNLELATLDGVLTANIQPEGLQEGDVIVLATTTDHVDPVLKNHVEATFAPWGSAQIGLAHARLAWPSTLDVKIQKTGDLPATQPATRDGKKVFDLTMRDVEPVIDPKGAPVRFQIGRMGEATDFRSWADAAKLLMPLYRDAAVVPASGPLHDEVEKIRKASADPKIRTEQALQLVQERVRYVALLMGQGGLVPAAAEATWSRRFGDCKAKTALLLAILHELKIEAEPVIVNATVGDIVADRLPSIGIFNHVLVRAHVAGNTYWLDGTRTGDTSLDGIKVPDFGWGLPLVENAALVRIIPPPLDVPTVDSKVLIDAAAGVRASEPVKFEQTIRGDDAVAFNNGVNALTEAQRREFFRAYWHKEYDFVTPGETSATFDSRTSTYRLAMSGSAKLDWNTNAFHVPETSLGYSPDFDRPPGPLHDVALAVAYPYFVHRQTTIRLPPGFFGSRESGSTPATDEKLAGIEYKMSTAHHSDALADTLIIDSSARSLVPEVPYKDGVSASARLRQLSAEDVAVPLPANYRPTKADLAAMMNDEPTTADGFKLRAGALMTAGKIEQALTDLDSAVALAPKDASILAARAFVLLMRQNPEVAEKDINAALAIDPNHVGALHDRAILAQIRGDNKTAAEIFERLVNEHPENPVDLGPLANAQHALGKDDEALATSAEALRRNPKEMELRVLRANILFIRGDRAAVAEEARLLTEQNPSSEFAFTAAGKIYSGLGQREKAMSALQRALTIKPYPYIYINRAQVRASSDVAGRMGDLDAALKLEANNPDALSEKAKLLTSNSDYKGALAILDKIKLDPNNGYSVLQRAVVLHRVGRSEDAQKLLEAARARATTAAELNGLCWTKATEDIMLASALQDCRDALKLNPEAGQYLDSLGMALLKLGKLDEALDAYNKAIAKNTGADSLMGRAFVYLRKGDRVHSQADAEAARKLSPDIEKSFADYGLRFDSKATRRAAN